MASKIRYTTSPIIESIMKMFSGRVCNQQHRYTDGLSTLRETDPKLPDGEYHKLSNNNYHKHDARRLVKDPLVYSNKNLLTDGSKKEDEGLYTPGPVYYKK